MSLIVQKFGGTSVKDAQRIRNVAGIIAETYLQGNDVIVVLSAQGDTTDDLIAKAEEINPHASKREMDMLLSTGEQISVALCAMALESMGLPCVSLAAWQVGIQSTSVHSDARIKKIDSERIQSELDQHRIVIVTGFQGVDRNGDVTTLGRGGSDTTAVALAAALEADRCEIYTDVDGIYTADPRLIPSARKLPRIDLRVMLALARAGSQVLHSKSVELALANNIDIHLLSSFESAPASLVCRLKETERPAFAGVTRCKGESSLSLAGKAADASALSRMVVLLSEAGIPVRSGQLEEGRVSVQLDPQQLDAAMQLIHDEMVLKQ